MDIGFAGQHLLPREASILGVMLQAKGQDVRFARET